MGLVMLSVAKSIQESGHSSGAAGAAAHDPVGTAHSSDATHHESGHEGASHSSGAAGAAAHDQAAGHGPSGSHDHDHAHAHAHAHPHPHPDPHPDPHPHPQPH